MKKKVIIVESPAKAKTIQRFLGDSYIVLSSMGHVRDLPENEFGVNIDKGFKPIFRLIKGKKKIMDRIKEMVKKSDGVLLASDMDREGEAIAWHIAEILKLDKNQRNRIIFSEITEKVIKEAVKNPRTIDMRKVHAQIARRILDRIVGYKLSPLLWKIMKSGLSAGRVQSVALRFICEREEEIRKFIPKEFWRIFGIHDGKKVNLIEVDGKKFDPVKSLIDEEKANEIVEELKKKRFFVKNVEKKISQKKPPDPFITSTLQQEAANKLGFSVAKTMRIAQELYEGIDTPDGHLAFITYMRTDSTRVSEEAVKSAEKFIVENYGEEFVRGRRKKERKSKGRIQDAHEAIRPTYPEKKPEDLKKILGKDHLKLYELIWKRFMASQMAPSKYENMIFRIASDDDKYVFEIKHSRRTFEGFEVLLPTQDAEKGTLLKLKEGDEFFFEKFTAEKDQTQPPSRYTEASLVKKLEKEGIGRPSTYATIIKTLFDRNYVVRSGKYIIPTFMGFLVNEFLVSNFPDIVETKFTAKMEEGLDEVESGKKDWREILENFYEKFRLVFEKVEKRINSKEMILEIPTDLECDECGGKMNLRFGPFGTYLKCEKCGKTMSTKNEEKFRLEDGVLRVKDAMVDEVVENAVCPKCGSPLVVKDGKYGKFLACSSYPKCDYTAPYVEKARGKCPKCGSDVLKRKSKKGKVYYICERNLREKECDFISWYEPSEYKCPVCSETLYYRYKNGEEVLYCQRCRKSYRVEEIAISQEESEE